MQNTAEQQGWESVYQAALVMLCTILQTYAGNWLQRELLSLCAYTVIQEGLLMETPV